LQPERLLVSKYGKNALAAGALPRAPLGELAALPQTPNGTLGRKDEEKNRRGRNVTKEREGRKDKKGEGNRKKGGGGAPTDQLCPHPLTQHLNPGDATAAIAEYSC